MLNEIVKILGDYGFDILSFTVEDGLLKISIYKNDKEKIITVTKEIMEHGRNIPNLLRAIIDAEKMEEWLKIKEKEDK